MFEKSLYDLIRGLRSHKGNESAYLQGALKECRSEIRSPDMDLKATALLKLIYLEMFGHDMTWAAFNVLEVMSSAKILQKRVGYLAAVQIFRPDTDILMLATNLLKKDLTSPSIPVMSMPLSALPHIVTSSLALSLLTDLLPRLSHSHPAVRKKTVVTLYRLALVYPETLRVAWPKIKDKLMDEDEHSSVTAAVINVVCELGWRRPHDFLPLAPRLFDLLVEGGNNWMAIKIIKLFATLTPLEPRLVKKLLRPLMGIIQTTSAMSLLYECINGIIQGGILDATDGIREGEEVANLCISKLRGMIVVEGDPNLKYVALVAFNKVVLSHPVLVAVQQDVIMGCLDDHDISIRLQALELVSGMVSSDNLQPIVNRLMRQLRNSPIQNKEEEEILPVATSIQPAADSDGEDPAETLTPVRIGTKSPPPLPTEYRQEVVKRILDVSSRDSYANVSDFEWYIEILLDLVRYVPQTVTAEEFDLASRIGYQLRDVAVRVKSLRPEATRAAESLVLVHNREKLFPPGGGGLKVLEAAAWIVGEYASDLADPPQLLDALMHDSTLTLPDSVVATYVQAIPKVFSVIAAEAANIWDAHQQTGITLLLARTVNFLERLSDHPNLDVQERAVEFLELFRLAKDALSSQDKVLEEAPLLLTSAIPSLFTGMEINPVAPGAQRKVPKPDDLDLDVPINSDLATVLNTQMHTFELDIDMQEAYSYYYTRPSAAATLPEPSRSHEPPSDSAPVSYQSQPEDPQATALRRAARRQRNQDDPFYIPSEESGRSTPFHQILSNSNGQDELDIDAIPIIDLQLDPSEAQAPQPDQKKRIKKKVPRKFQIAADETLDDPSTHSPLSTSPSTTAPPPTTRPPSATLAPRPRPPTKPSLLQVDSSTLTSLALYDNNDPSSEDPATSSGKDLASIVAAREREEAEMAAAIKEVERLRLQMQRDQERVVLASDEGMDQEGREVVKRSKGRRRKVAGSNVNSTSNTPPVANTPPISSGQEQSIHQPTSTTPDNTTVDAEPKKKKKKKIIVRKKRKPVASGDDIVVPGTTAAVADDESGNRDAVVE
ncbi:putative ap-3 complex subunit delta [Phaeomoniella chlamydospora]|uniref:AP-3 complex subunit delta n=1 Tax=Phaeomoniella chlamydospora TaxID=158046 RepID=A0A0G2GKH1_PHACM|nr:putative ap-3 complex subunit delta [Phaeomoniella chlamydospora]